MRRGTRRGQSIADALRVVIRDDHGDISSPESSPDTPHSTASTPSPTTTTTTSSSKSTKVKSVSTAPSTTTTLPPPAVTSAATSSIVPFLNHPELSSTTSLNSIPSISSQLQPTTTNPPAITTAPLALAPINSNAASSTLTRSSILSNAPTSSVTAGRQVMDGSKATASVTSDFDSTPSDDGLGQQPAYTYDGHPHLDAGAVAGIAIGSSLGTLLIAALLFLLWRKWNKRDSKSGDQDSKDRSGSGPVSSVRQYLPRRFTHRSDDRIMNELMTAAYSAENGRRSSYMDQMPVNGNGYIQEKMQRFEEDDIPIMLPEPEPVAPRFKRTKRISKWLGRHESQMLNPNYARASLASNATGLRSLDLRSMSGWGSDDGYSEYTRYTEPPTKLRPAPRREDEEEQRLPDVQGMGVMVRDSTPITQFPSPEELKLPPPPVRPPSIAARTEVTGRSSGTWNTWGVMQHREEPKGWKDKLGM